MPLNQLVTAAPGRLCLFGEHQDFLGLPVIALAMTRQITFSGVRRRDMLFNIHLPDIGDHEVIDPRNELPYRHCRDYLRSAVNVLRREGLRYSRGYDITVQGNIPINAGCGSSSSMLVSWVAFLAASQDDSFPCDPVTVARLAYKAEVREFDEPGGMMDHYTSALGGLLYIQTEGEVECTRLPAKLSGFVLGDSRTPKDTTSTLARSRRAMAEAVAVAQQEIPGFDIHTTSLEEARTLFSKLEKRGQEMLEGNLINRDICREAYILLQTETPDVRKIGNLLLSHHDQLSRNIQVSTAKIDRMVEAAMQAGALGAKINGSGGGGCMFAFAPNHELAVAEAIRAAGGEAFIVESHPGLQVSSA
ncbi:MAG: mevalonate kinase family protein [Candidatus Zipacnadales bacterium]